MPEVTGSEPPNERVLSKEDAEELARLVGLLLGNGSAQQPEGRGRLVERARAIFNERKRRSEFLPRNLFDEPGWDMLLALYVTDFAGGRQTIGRLVSWIGAPVTTSLRWIAYLEDHGLISREPHPRDQRTAFVDITDAGRQALDQYFSSMSRSPPGPIVQLRQEHPKRTAAR